MSDSRMPSPPGGWAKDRDNPPYELMTLRDWFAGQVIGQLIIMERRQPEHDFTTVQGRIDWYASESYRVADAMLKARGAK